MNNLEELKKYCTETIRKYPELKSDINELYNLCISEIESGESLQNEIYLCLAGINDLFLNYK